MLSPRELSSDFEDFSDSCSSFQIDYSYDFPSSMYDYSNSSSYYSEDDIFFFSSNEFSENSTSSDRKIQMIDENTNLIKLDENSIINNTDDSIQLCYESTNNTKRQKIDGIELIGSTSSIQLIKTDRVPVSLEGKLQHLGTKKVNAECMICFEKVCKIYDLKCKHIFHMHCILKWLYQNNTCPLCRIPAVLGIFNGRYF